MPKSIYEIKLVNRFIPAASVEDAMETYQMNLSGAKLSDDDVNIHEIVTDQATLKLFILAKTMEDMDDRFDYNEVKAAVYALARELGCENYREIADCVLIWVERFEDMSLAELEEWLIG